MRPLTCFDVTVDAGVAHVRMIRPESHNSMIPEFWDELPALMTDLDRSGSVRAAVLSSTGKHFCSGMDVAVFAGESALLPDAGSTEPGRARAALALVVQRLQFTASVLERTRFPVLAAVQGACIGGAVDVICAADLRYASADAYFRIAETNIGMTADVGTLQRLPTLVPAGLAREWAMTGAPVSADRAYQAGLVNQVFADHDELVAGVLDVARQIARQSPLAVWGTKSALLYARDHSVTDGLAQIAGWQAGMFWPEHDVAEALRARLEGDEPTFADLPPRPDPGPWEASP